MDFFESQARARQRTRRLIVLFGLAVGGTVLAGYFSAIFLLGQLPEQTDSYSRPGSGIGGPAGTPALWQPEVFATVSVLTLVLVGLASLYKWTQFRSGGGAVAESVGGRRIDPHTTDLQERRLLNVVEEMAIASGVSMPTVYVLDDEPAINAFAAGITTNDAVVAVTRGMLEKLTRDELQGVIGHEFSHILNGDMRLNVKLSAILFGILVLGLIGRGILQSLRFSRPRGKNAGGGIALMLAAGLALVIVGYVGYFFGRLIQAAVSRQREFLADASAVQFTRNPGGLTGALKKIGGYALGSSIQASKSTAIGHFFFAQGFRSMFGGLWATHPPLPERIRAIDPRFDGNFIEPAEVVDVTRESFVSAGLVPPPPSALPRPGRPIPEFNPQRASTAGDMMAAIGTLTAAQLANAGTLLASVPPRLLAAARSTPEAPALLYGLLLEAEPDVRRRQIDLVASRAGERVALLLEQLAPALQELKPDHKLPLLQLAQPALREIPADALEPLFSTLDELVHVNGRVSTFEFALQKIILRTLSIGRGPGAEVVQIYSFHAVIPEIAIVLSALAHASSNPGEDSARSFSAGAAQLKLLEGKLALLPPEACGLVPLDAALDKLATASGPIKHRLLSAAAQIVSADGVIFVTEAELLRAIAATLDVPMPPVAIQS